MVEALLVLGGAATVLVAQWLVRRLVPIRIKEHERIIGFSATAPEDFWHVTFHAPDGWNPNLQISHHHLTDNPRMWRW